MYNYWNAGNKTPPIKSQLSYNINAIDETKIWIPAKIQWFKSLLLILLLLLIKTNWQQQTNQSHQDVFDCLNLKAIMILKHIPLKKHWPEFRLHWLLFKIPTINHINGFIMVILSTLILLFHLKNFKTNLIKTIEGIDFIKQSIKLYQ